MTLPWQPLRWRKRRHEFRRIAAFFKQSFELKIKGDLIPEDAAEEIIGELQALFARHNAGAALSAKAVFKPTKEFHTARDRINFELGMLNLELQRSPKSPSGFSFQVSRFSFFLRGAGRGEREDEAREVRDGGGVSGGHKTTLSGRLRNVPAHRDQATRSRLKAPGNTWF